MTKAQIAIEIGFDKIRACTRMGREINKVPLGLCSAPYAFPPIGVKSHFGYKFGEIAKMSAVTSPDVIVFFYDYLRQNAIPREALTALLRTIIEKTEKSFNVNVEAIALITPPYFKDIVQSKFLEDCINSISKELEVKDTTISFSRSYLNVNVGQKVLFLDFRDNPTYMSLISRGTRSYESIGAQTIEDFSYINCENFIEDKILSRFDSTLFPDREIVAAWIQGEVASKISQDAVSQLLMGKDVAYEIPFGADKISIIQSEFHNWLLTRLDKVCERIIGFVRDSGLSISDFSQVVLLGNIFENQLIRARVEKFFNGYTQEIQYSYFSSLMDEWKICESVLINNNNSLYALEL